MPLVRGQGFGTFVVQARSSAKRFRVVIAVVAAMFVGGCGATYQKWSLVSLTGGYYSAKLASGEYRVGYEGNALVTNEMMRDFALLRCAEVTIEDGANFFEVMTQVALWRDGVIRKVELVIRLHHSAPESSFGEVFLASSVIDEVKTRYE